MRMKILFCPLLLLACRQSTAVFVPDIPSSGWIFSTTAGVPGNATAEQILELEKSSHLSRLALKAPPLDITYPNDSSVFPPDLVPPRLAWINPELRCKWWRIDFLPGETEGFTIIKSSGGPPELKIDSNAIPDNAPLRLARPADMEYYDVPDNVWRQFKARTLETFGTLRITGFDAEAKPVTARTLRIKTSRDSVGAPIFYRDVPFMPVLNVKKGAVLPLDDFNMKYINWRLRDLSRPASKVVLGDMPTCANCHSFARNGSRMGMDIDGTQGDKGAYGIQKVSKTTVFDRKDIISWNYDFKERKSIKPTFGFLSSLSPDGNHVVTTVREELFIVGYVDQEFSQVFYPTRGVLAYYSEAKKEAVSLPGANDSAFVHCSPTWTPDGKSIIFSRGRAKNPFTPNQKMPAKANDPEETPMQYDLYRIDFNGGKGGVAVPIKGASQNGMSNSFAKVTPDGKFIVWVQSRNGLLMRPDSRLWIVPTGGGEPRQMNCNTWRMNSWHSFSPNGRWMVFSSKAFTMYTQLFLTHLDADGMDTPPILIPNSTVDNRAANLPEFANIRYSDLDTIEVPAISHFRYRLEAGKNIDAGNKEKAIALLKKGLQEEQQDKMIRAEMMATIGDLSKDPEEAIALFKEAAKTDTNYGQAYLQLGMLHARIGKEKEAIRYFERCLAKSPDNFFAMIQLCQIYLAPDDPKRKDIDLAFRYIKKANELTYYQFDYPLQNLARVYSEMKDFPKAIEMAELGIQRAREKKSHERAETIRNELNAYRQNRGFLSIATKSR